MLPWVVICRSALRRTRKSLPLNLFADPHPLNPVPSIFYKNIGGRGVMFLRCSDVATCERPDLNLLQCAVAAKHRVLPVFSRNRQQSSPLAATLMDYVVSVDSKWFTENLSPLVATLTKNTGGEATFSSTFGRSDVRLSTFRQSHCSQTPLVPQSPKVPSFFTIRGNNSAPPGV
jgi:hypothetical protein